MNMVSDEDVENYVLPIINMASEDIKICYLKNMYWPLWIS